MLFSEYSVPGEESGGWVMYLGERVLGVMEDNGWSITTKALGGICTSVFVSMPGTQGHIITLAAPAEQLHLCPSTGLVCQDTYPSAALS